MPGDANPVRARARLALVASTAVLFVSAAVGCEPGTITIEPDEIPTAASGQYYEAEFTALGGPDVISATQVPQGLHFVHAGDKGMLFGTPPAPGNFDIVVTAGDNPTMLSRARSSSETYELIVQLPVGSVDRVQFASFVPLWMTPGEEFSFDFCRDQIFDPFATPTPSRSPATEAPTPSAGASGPCAEAGIVGGGRPPYRFVFYCVGRADFCASPEDVYVKPPTGFALSEDGLLSGTAPSGGNYDFVVCAIDQQDDHACGLVSATAL